MQRCVGCVGCVRVPRYLRIARRRAKSRVDATRPAQVSTPGHPTIKTPNLSRPAPFLPPLSSFLSFQLFIDHHHLQRAPSKLDIHNHRDQQTTADTMTTDTKIAPRGLTPADFRFKPPLLTNPHQDALTSIGKPGLRATKKHGPQHRKHRKRSTSHQKKCFCSEPPPPQDRK